MASDTPLTENAAVDFLERAIAGDVRYTPLPDEMPSWGSAATEESDESESGDSATAGEGQCKGPGAAGSDDGGEGQCQGP